MKTIAIVGATGAVGQQMLKCLEERNIQCNLKLLASARSKGKKFKFFDQEIICEELNPDSFKDVDFALGATENDIAKTWIPWALENNVVIVDNSSAFRLDQDVPLVIPEINPEDIAKNKGIIANPNCATIIALVALNALHKEFKIKRMIVTTFQAVSGAGVKGIQDLENQLKDPTAPCNAFPYPIAYNLIPQIGDFDDLGISKEEWKLQNESRKILHDDNLLVNCTCVRVPILRSHSESITIECEKEIDITKARELLSSAQGVLLKDDPLHKQYPMPLETTDQDLVYVGRVRKDISDPTNHSLSLFCCGDQIRKGAATNAVQILEKLL
ncbi:aspartate-semialdehyde dehydrogenase [Faecalitalea cylindroides]|uniref:Aspartate-semialdehyde dehydrogenase n=3 Tax=Faecalitalea cylindroides TaxID=39483 RepID=A0AAW6FU85_9FIRM|nr:aspartate-semialdehyde dehydrogenase [Faecalitalea cylindroides]ERK45260.1 aspartate-semialdehyde dehydrogenase [[Eubacterium] cylindroides ATCC 27803] [Faecalitalea cylindroides ATCC 27803]MDC0828289.1 aspartate-semialdehyde dehydrogenase [Faecalitalea cylindroides]MEE1448345.1 aspartate-semialdehyde dehydrogenase [Faecalitalea cylindroides]